MTCPPEKAHCCYVCDGNSGVSSGGLKKCNKKDKGKKKRKIGKKKKKEEQSHVRRFRHVTDTELVSAVFLFCHLA